MSLISKVKCGRCDRSYSGLKSKCPYCGAGRSRSGKRSSDVSDATARRMIQAVLVLTLVITVIAMAVTDFDADPAEGGSGLGGGAGTEQGTGTDTNTGTDAGDGEENGDNTPPPPTPQPTPTPIEVTSINIRWSAQRGDANDMTIRVGQSIELWSEVFPTDADAEVLWDRGDHLIANITVNPEDHRRVTVEARSAGNTRVWAEAGNERAEVIVRVQP